MNPNRKNTGVKPALHPAVFWVKLSRLNLLRRQDDVIKRHGVAGTGGILASDRKFKRVITRRREIKCSKIE